MGSSPRRPDPPKQVEAPPKEDDPEVKKAAAEALRRKTRQRGYRSTVIAKDMMSDDVAKKLETLGS